MLRAHVDFSRKLRDWDGFGICFTDKAIVDPLEYFSLNDNHYQFLKDLFDVNGLRIGIIKMFIDPFHLDYCQHDSDEDRIIEIGDYHFNDTPSFHSELCHLANNIVKKWGGNLKIMLTSLCPPPWMTKQKELSARDLDPINRIDYGRYIVAWAKFLSIDQKLPITCISLHNKGEMWELWDDTGNLLYSNTGLSLHWPPEMVVDFLKLVRRQLDRNGMQHIGLTPGETKCWGHFYDWGYADLIKEDPLALSSVSILTSNAFFSDHENDYCSAGIDSIHEKRPEIHAWVNSDDIANMKTESISSLHKLIYRTKVNAVIFNTTIKDKNTLAFNNKEFSYMRLVCKAGQPGTGICQVGCNGSDLFIIGFCSNSTKNSDSFMLINNGTRGWNIPIEIRGSASGKFSVYRTSASEEYLKLGEVSVKEGKISYYAPGNSVSGFFSKLQSSY